MNEHQRRIIELLRSKQPTKQFAPVKYIASPPLAPSSPPIRPPFYKPPVKSKWKQFVEREHMIAKRVDPETVALTKRVGAETKQAVVSDDTTEPETKRDHRGWNYEIKTEPAIDIIGYSFFRTKFNTTVARCQCCWLGFAGDFKAIKPKMTAHRQASHRSDQ
jgi:hypothetical protein